MYKLYNYCTVIYAKINRLFEFCTYIGDFYRATDIESGKSGTPVRPGYHQHQKPAPANLHRLQSGRASKEAGCRTEHSDQLFAQPGHTE